MVSKHFFSIDKNHERTHLGYSKYSHQNVLGLSAMTIHAIYFTLVYIRIIIGILWMIAFDDQRVFKF